MKYLALVLACLSLGCDTVSHLAPSASLSSEPKEGFMIESARGRQDRARLKLGETLKLSAIRYEMWPGPRHALDTGVRWISEDPSIATVDTHGVVNAVRFGTTIIFAICETCPAEAVNKREAESIRRADAVNKRAAELVLEAAGMPVAMFPIVIWPHMPPDPHVPRVDFPDQGIYVVPPARPPKFFGRFCCERS